jgi:multidrug resistance efflux pump
VHQAETALYLAQLQLDKTTVRAPTSGIVAATSLFTGAMAAVGAPALVMISPEVELVIAVEEARMAALRIGQTVQIETLAYPGQLYRGSVVAIAPQIDTTTNTIEITIQPIISQADGALPALKPGMFATVEFVVADAATTE